MMLKECVSIHGSPPNEHSLLMPSAVFADIQHLTENTVLVKYATLQREYSKKGRRDVLIPRNKYVNLQTAVTRQRCK
jgi:hypothetical protein